MKAVNDKPHESGSCLGTVHYMGGAAYRRAPPVIMDVRARFVDHIHQERVPCSSVDLRHDE